MTTLSPSIIMLGATGAVGTEVLHALQSRDQCSRLTLLGRRPHPAADRPWVEQHTVDVLLPSSYVGCLMGHDVAICTLGVGQPSEMSKEEFVRIDKTAVLDFATACKVAGIRHFELLASVGSDRESRSFYLRTKGELVYQLEALGFERLSVFLPSMILTPTNRYGLLQGLTLAVWPVIDKVLVGPLKQYRGITVDRLGQAIAANVYRTGVGVERLLWSDYLALTSDPD